MEKMEISHKTIFFTIFFLLCLWFLYLIREIIVLLFVSLIFMFALNPIVTKMEKFKIPRQAAILLIYVFIIALFSSLIASLVPMMVRQTNTLVESLPKLLQNLRFFNIEIRPSDYSTELAKLPGNIFKLVAATFSNILGVFVFMVFTFYLLMERKNMGRYLHKLLKAEGEKRAEEFIDRVETKIGSWVRGEIFLMFIIGLMSYVGLRILDFEFALPLAVMAGILELVPNIGPVLSTIPAALVGLSLSPVIGITIIILYFLIQQLENHLIVPKVMQKAAGLNPLVTLTALMIGLKLDGAMGAVLAIPAFLMIKVIVKEIYELRMSSKTTKV